MKCSIYTENRGANVHNVISVKVKVYFYHICLYKLNLLSQYFSITNVNVIAKLGISKLTANWTLIFAANWKQSIFSNECQIESKRSNSIYCIWNSKWSVIYITGSIEHYKKKIYIYMRYVQARLFKRKLDSWSKF